MNLALVHPALPYAVVALIGLCVGSFLNVVIYRLPVMMERAWESAGGQTAPVGTFNLAIPGSSCPECGAGIQWWQNIPVLSYLLLRGRCQACRCRISARYPLIELGTMLLSLVVLARFGTGSDMLLALITTWFLISLAVIDFDHQLLPDALTLPLLWIGLLASLLPVFAEPRSAIIGAAAGYALLWGVFHVFRLCTGKEGMGYGDFKLLAAIGALLGWQALPAVILLSSMVGALLGVLLIVATGRDRNVPMPFGPYLAAAGWLVMLWGEEMQRHAAFLFI